MSYKRVQDHRLIISSQPGFQFRLTQGCDLKPCDIVSLLQALISILDWVLIKSVYFLFAFVNWHYLICELFAANVTSDELMTQLSHSYEVFQEQQRTEIQEEVSTVFVLDFHIASIIWPL